MFNFHLWGDILQIIIAIKNNKQYEKKWNRGKQSLSKLEIGNGSNKNIASVSFSTKLKKSSNLRNHVLGMLDKLPLRRVKRTNKNVICNSNNLYLLEFSDSKEECVHLMHILEGNFLRRCINTFQFPIIF